MRLMLDVEVLRRNIEVLMLIAGERGYEMAFMIKKQFAHWGLVVNELREHNVYSTGDCVHGWVDIYNSEKVVVVDAYDQREGVPKTLAKQLAGKRKTAVVNFCCCNGIVPSLMDLEGIDDELRGMGFGRTSFGGSLMLSFGKLPCTEVRVGEALLTGYSAHPYEERYDGLENPFSVEFNAVRGSQGNVVINHGFLEIGGFTDEKPRCVNTDFTVFDRKYSGNKIVLKPDFYTLIKMAHNGVLPVGV